MSKKYFLLICFVLSILISSCDKPDKKNATPENVPDYEKMGWIYLKGEGVPQNFALALKWYQTGANAGDAGCQYNLGTMYERGEGVAPDFKKAAELYQSAADQGNKNGQFNLGVLYSLGQGVAQDQTNAVKYLELAANQGHADAQFYLGQRYEEGRGVAVDLMRAHYWFNLAAAQNRENAAQKRDALATRMSPEELSKAQQLASTWKPVTAQVKTKNNSKADVLGQAVGEFRQMALKDYSQAVDAKANRLVHQKFSEFNPLIWPDTDPKMGWSYFMNVSVIAMGGVVTPHPLVAFYNPWADVFLLTVWEMQNEKAVMVDADVLMGDWVRSEKFPSNPIPLWIRNPDFKPVALGQAVAQSVKAFEKRFHDADGNVWNLFLNFSDNKEIAVDFNYSGVSLLLANSLARIDNYRVSREGENIQLPLIRVKAAQFLTQASSGKIKELLQGASDTLPVMQDLLLQVPVSVFTTLTPVSLLVDEGEAMLFLASINNANSCVSLLMKKVNNEWGVTRIDVVSYKGFYGQL